MTCAGPLSWETLVAYWAGDLPPDEEETTELHLMGCAACTAQAEKVAAVAQGIRSSRQELPVVSREKRGPAAPPRRRFLYSSVGAATLAAAAAIFFLLPRAAHDFSVQLPAPVRDAALVEIHPPADARDVRLEPEGASANAARLRRVDDGTWLTVRVSAGPPFAVVVPRSALTHGTYELELVWAADGHEDAKGFYRFQIAP